MQDFGPKIVLRAKELYLSPDEAGRKRSFSDVAKLLTEELGRNIGRSTVAGWAKDQGWKVDSGGEGGGGGFLTLPIREIPATPEEFDWQAAKLRLLPQLIGLSEDCFAIVRGAGGKAPQLVFKDAEGAIRTGLASLEMAGKIQAGKFEKEQGDQLPALSPQQVQQFIMFSIHGGDIPKFELEPPPIVEVQTVEVPSADPS